MKNKNVLLILATIVFALMVVLPVGAQSPHKEYFEFSEFRSIDCGSFTVLQEDFISGHITTFFNSDGSPDRFQAHVDIVGTITHLGTGQSFKDHAAVNFTGELPFDEVSEVSRGIYWHLHLPGEGMVVLRAGRVILDENGLAIFTSGANTDTPPYQLLCEKLASL